MDDKKRVYIIAAGVFFLLLLLILVVSIISSNRKNSTTNDTAILTIWDYNDEASAFSEVMSEFQSNYKNLKINFVTKNPDEYLTDSLNELAAGRGPDIWIIPNDWLPKYNDKLTPMTTGLIASKKQKKDDLEMYRSTFLGAVAQDNIIDNKIYGMPMAVDPLVLYFNNELLRKAQNEFFANNPNPDENQTQLLSYSGYSAKNWDDLTASIKLMVSKNGNTINRAGMAFGTANNVQNAADIVGWMMMQQGTRMISEDLALAQFHTKQNVLDGEPFPGRRALELYTSFANPKSENYTWNETMPNSRRAFAEGKTVLLIDYMSAEVDIKRINPNIDYGLTAVPQIKETKNPVNFISYDTLTVPRTAPNSAMAWDFIIFATNSINANKYLMVTHKMSALAYQANDALDPYIKQMATAQSWYKPDPQKTDEIFTQMVQQVNLGESAQTAVEEAAAKITELLGKLKNP